mmetsp:Transcript_13108/g.18560  ORF Transcript_13108/g.18560 Transcript_13108/m.18560 type:complete len:908 (+) Transcript_13108:46-2769(+)
MFKKKVPVMLTQLLRLTLGFLLVGVSSSRIIGSTLQSKRALAIDLDILIPKGGGRGYIFPDETIVSESKEFQLNISKKGRLVLSRSPTDIAWQSDFEGSDDKEYYGKLQGDGNFLVREGTRTYKGDAVWKSNKRSSSGGPFQLGVDKDNSLLVVYDLGNDEILWEANISAPPPPTIAPTSAPTGAPSANPTTPLTETPTVSPTGSAQDHDTGETPSPTVSPTQKRTISPTSDPTASPVVTETLSPTPSPITTPPTAAIVTTPPTTTPTKSPTILPTAPPTILPTAPPTPLPTNQPTVPKPRFDYIMASGTYLTENNVIYSTSKDFHLYQRKDGNLILSVGAQGIAWESGYSGSEIQYNTKVQGDGQFLTKTGPPTDRKDTVWKSKATDTGGPFMLAVDRSQNTLGVYHYSKSSGELGKPIWLVPIEGPPATDSPSVSPTSSPSSRPTVSPTISPSGSPSAQPSKAPTAVPSAIPSLHHSSSPSAIPSLYHSSFPTTSTEPSGEPTALPSEYPSGAPSALPTRNPTGTQSSSPSNSISSQAYPFNPEDFVDSIAIQRGEEFDDDSSYQSRALKWLKEREEFASMTKTQIRQLYALACIYYATSAVPNTYTVHFFGDDTPTWVRSGNWLENVYECSWAGVKCSGGKVVEIDFNGGDLTGTLPIELTLLSDLTSLDLFGNYMHNYGDEGNAWLGQLTNLRYLNYGDTFFEYDGIPTEIGLLTNLRHYEADYTVYYGPLRGEIFESLTQLEILIIGGNSYGSPVPTQLSALPKLKYFYIEDSHVTGDLDYLENMTSLVDHAAYGNPALGGTIPSTLPTTLKGLAMHDCSITGTIPSEMGLLTDMQQIWFNSNELSGVIPSEIGKMTKLQKFNVSDNNIVGNVSDAICDLRVTYLIADCLESVECSCCLECL